MNDLTPEQSIAAEKTALYRGIRDVLLTARTQTRQAINDTMVQAYWQVGRLIVEDEQGGEKRAEYGKRVLPELAKRLSAEFGEGFSAPSLWNYRQFYLEFPIQGAHASQKSASPPLVCQRGRQSGLECAGAGSADKYFIL